MLKQTILALGAAALLAGCGATTNKTVKTDERAVVAKDVLVNTFVDKDGGVYTVNSTDAYNTAKFTDANGKIHNLKREPSANGIRLVDGDTEVFFTHKDVFMTVDGKQIPATIK